MRRTQRPPDVDVDVDVCELASDRLDRLGLASAFTLPELHEAVERLRGRAVELIPRRLPALAPHGLWVAAEHADYVFYDCSIGHVRQHQIIGHEFGHIIFDAADNAPETGTTTTGESMDGVVASVLERRRSAYDSAAERRAELFGTVALARMQPWRARPPGAGAHDPVLDALAVVFEGKW